MVCEKETPSCLDNCPNFERIRDSFWDGGAIDKNGKPIRVCGPAVRYVCGKEDQLTWDDYRDFKGREDISGH